MQLQECRMPAKITVVEAIDLYRSFYPRPRATSELFERFGLHAERDVRFEKLSGGKQQRLSVALALVGNPQVAILDELTTGLDPAGRREIWSYLTELRRAGLTIVLVTHYLDEAEHLCDRVILFRQGRSTRMRFEPSKMSPASRWTAIESSSPGTMTWPERFLPDWALAASWRITCVWPGVSWRRPTSR